MTRTERRPSIARPLLATAAVAGLLAVGASPSANPQPVDDPLSRPTVVLRMEEVGGFAPLQASLLGVPAFTLYGDGLAIFVAPEEAGTGDGTHPPMRLATLNGAQVESLLGAALDRVGGLRDARHEYAVGGVADATTTVFTVNGDGIDRTVSVYGLGFGNAGPDRDALRRLEALARLLSDADAWLPEGTEVNDYEPIAYRGVFTEDDPEGPDVRPWPWDDLSQADLRPVEDATAISQADLTPGQVALVTDVPNGGAFDIAIAAPDGSAAWRMAVRPMLPDEPSLTIMPAPSRVPGTPRPSEREDDDGY